MSLIDTTAFINNKGTLILKEVGENEDYQKEENFNCPECQCTFIETGKSISVQHFYKCETCFPDSKIRLICAACAAKCHKGHLLIDAGVLSGYCDCGSGALPSNHSCQRLLSFKKKLNLVNLAKSRRDNFRFITNHVCWSGKGEVVEVIIKKIHQTNNNSVFIEDENEEEEFEREKRKGEINSNDEDNYKENSLNKGIQHESNLNLPISNNHISEENIKSKTSHGKRKIEFSKSSDTFMRSYDDHYIQSARRMNKKAPISRRASATWKRPQPPNDGRFVVFINPKKNNITS